MPVRVSSWSIEPHRLARARLRWLWGLLALLPRPVAAHGLPPSAVSVVAQDARGPRSVRLSAGLAQRQPDETFRYVCPALWGDTDTLPAYGLPGQPAIVLSSTGLWLLHDDGSVAPHPDPQARGYAFDLAAQGGKLYVLRSYQKSGSELLEVDAEHVRSLWHDAALWSTLAAGDGFLAVARLTDDAQLAQQKLTAEGVPIASAQAKAPPGTVTVLARAAGSELYLVVSYNGGRQLGQLDASGFRVLQSASASLLGPVQGATGDPYLALDGALSHMQAGTVMPLAEAGDTPVSGLGCYEQQCYACTRDGVAPLTAAGLGSLTFALSRLVPPALAGLPQATADMCDLQWQHFRFDLLGLGVELREPAAMGSVAAPTAGGSASAGMSAPAAGTAAASGTAGTSAPAAGSGTGPAATAGTSAPAAGSGTGPAAVRSAQSSAAKSGGCSLTGAAHGGPPGWMSMGLAWLWRRRARRRGP